MVVNFKNECRIAGIVCKCKRLEQGFELTYTASGTPMLKINLLHKKIWQDKDTNEDKSKSTFFDLVAWGKPAEDYARKLSLNCAIEVNSEFTKRTVQRNDGPGMATYTEFIIRDLKVIGSASETGQQDNGEQQTPPQQQRPAQQPPAQPTQKPAYQKPAPQTQQPVRTSAGYQKPAPSKGTYTPEPNRVPPPPPQPAPASNSDIDDSDIPF